MYAYMCVGVCVGAGEGMKEIIISFFSIAYHLK